MDKLKYILTQDALTVTLAGRPYTISKDAPGFSNVRDAVLADQDPALVLEILQAPSKRARQAVETAMGIRKLTGKVTYSEGMIFYNGEAIFNHAADTLISFLNKGYAAEPLARFIEKQQANPDPAVHDHLYAFLEKGNIPLTADGDFLVYKAVRANYMDIHSGRFDNHVGQAPSMDRCAVDPNRNQTCSNGLHVCSFAYLPSFAHAQGHVMLCKVNPTDVVAIPNDYNDTKMRVARYEVVGEVTSYYKEGVDIVAQGREGGKFYEVEFAATADFWEEYSAHYTADEAMKEAKALSVDEDGWEVRAVDTRDDTILWETS